jgi:uncharacterized protein YcfJ
MPRRSLVLKIVLGLVALSGAASATTALAERAPTGAPAVFAISPWRESGLTPASPSERPDALTSARRNDVTAAGRVRTLGAIAGIAALAGLGGRRLRLVAIAFTKHARSFVARMRAPPLPSPLTR